MSAQRDGRFTICSEGWALAAATTGRWRHDEGMNALTNIAIAVVLAAAGGAASLAVNGSAAAAAPGATAIRGIADSTGDPVLLDTYWVIEAVIDGEVIIVPPPLPERYLIVRGAGKFEGYDGCNWIMGAAAVKGDVITFAGVGMTKRLCPDDNIWLEMKIFGALDDGDATYRIQDGRLFLSRADGPGLRLRPGTAPATD